MREKRLPCQQLKSVEFPEEPLYVTVNKFESYTLKEFMTECDKVLRHGQQFLPVVIDSYGGEVYTLLGMADFLKSLDVKVVTVCQAKAMSAGAILFSCGDERYIAPTSTIMIHEVSTFFWGKNIELQNEAKEVERLNKLLFDLLDKNTGQQKNFWSELVQKNHHTDLFLTATQAKKHNLATAIGIPYIETAIEVRRTLKL
jgi:ATP-dependent Clp endopeptidase proteolytic subunit ClpP